LKPLSVGQGVLIEVVEKLGGLDDAASRLEMTPSLLDRFVSGNAEVPDMLLLRAVDLVLEDAARDTTQVSQSSSRVT
jgi:hypothetical protein